jgi:hypothetical protein
MTEWEGLSRWTWVRGFVRALPLLPRAVWVQRREIWEAFWHGRSPRARAWEWGYRLSLRVFGLRPSQERCDEENPYLRG